MAEITSPTSIPGRSIPVPLQNLSPISSDSMQIQTVYTPVIATYRTRREYAVPAIRVTPGKGGAELSVFPLSQEEIGEIWTLPDELALWDLSTVVGGWSRAELKFRPMIAYPYELLKALLTVFQTQKFTNGATLSWTSWSEACRRPSDLIQVVGECAQCAIPRAFVPRVLWTAPKQLPSWTCECFGVACGEEHPEVITDADKEVWRHLGTGSRSVVSSYTASSKPPLRPPSVLSRPIVAAPVDLLQSSPQRQLGAIPENPRAGLLKGEILEKVTVKPEPEIGPLDSISNVDLASGNRQLLDSGFTAFQKPSKHPWGRRVERDLDSALLQEVSRYIVGQRLQKFDTPDPDQATIVAFEQESQGVRGNQLRRDFSKWMESHREAMFDGKDDVSVFTEWRETLEYYFSTSPILNDCTQAWLATFTFRRSAMRWWGSRMKQYPMLAVSFSQLVEWIRMELVPCANPDEAMTAWQKLAFRGDVEDYLRQYDKLTLCYPLSHSLTLSQATQPLGEEFKNSARRVDMQYGLAGMTHRQLRHYIELYLRELKPSDLKTLSERSLGRGGFGSYSGNVSRSRQQVHQAVVEPVREVSHEEWKGENVPQRPMPRPKVRVWGEDARDGSQGVRLSRKIGKGPRPCWICGSDQHGMFVCPKQRHRNSLCKVCGSEAHLTKACNQRYFPAEAPTTTQVAAGVANRAKTNRLRRQKESTPAEASQAKAPSSTASKEVGAASAAILENPLGQRLGLALGDYDRLEVWDPKSRVLRYRV